MKLTKKDKEKNNSKSAIRNFRSEKEGKLIDFKYLFYHACAKTHQVIMLQFKIIYEGMFKYHYQAPIGIH